MEFISTWRMEKEGNEGRDLTISRNRANFHQQSAFPWNFPSFSEGHIFFKKKTIGSKEDVRKKEENLELWRGQDRNSGEAEAKQVIQGDFSLSSL